MSFDYYYGDESNQFSFYRIPRQLITSADFRRISTDAKLLYGLLLDRMGLSAKNGWYDKAHLNLLMGQHKQKEQEYQDLRAETIKVVQGTSRLNADLLNSLVEETKTQIADLEQQIQKGKEELQVRSSNAEKVRQEYAQLVSWADMYDNCTFEAKKMIVAQFVKSVSVKRDYEIDITFSVAFEEFQEIYLEPETEEEKQIKTPLPLALAKTIRQAV